MGVSRASFLFSTTDKVDTNIQTLHSRTTKGSGKKWVWENHDDTLSHEDALKLWLTIAIDFSDFFNDHKIPPVSQRIGLLGSRWQARHLLKACDECNEGQGCSAWRCLPGLNWIDSGTSISNVQMKTTKDAAQHQSQTEVTHRFLATFFYVTSRHFCSMKVINLKIPLEPLIHHLELGSNFENVY